MLDYKNINKNIIALGFVSFFTDMASSMVTTVLPLYIVYILHSGVDKLGFVLAVATFVSYGFRFLFGYLSDRLQVVKPFVVTGYIVSAITKPLLYFSSSWQSIAILRGVERIGKAIRSATKDRLISEYSLGKSGKSFGFHKMMDIAGEMSGTVIVFLMLFFIGQDISVFKSIFALTLLPGILAVVVVIFFVKDVEYIDIKQKRDYSLMEDKKVLPILFLYFFFIFFMFSESFFIVKARESVDMKYIPLFIMLLTFVQTITSYWFGIIIDKIGVKKVLHISYICGILSMWFLYMDLIVFAFIFLGLFLVSGLNSIRSFIADNAKNRATVYGIFYAGVALFGACGAIVIGVIWHNFSQDIAILFSLFGTFVIYFIGIFLRVTD